VAFKSHVLSNETKVVLVTDEKGLLVQCCARQLSVCTEYIVAKRCILEQKLLLRAVGLYEKSIGTK